MLPKYIVIGHLLHPEPVRNLPVAIGILGLALLLDCWITYGNIREFTRRRGTQGFIAHQFSVRAHVALLQLQLR